ncbi:pyridoxamine 5'-phosphate oxidase family protein [Pseudonocardiaceae bacterium YIM PH 21723]|nr:pyridoxamine 5'-phosphate oxidase family protein [Pseudonocardiaceae bacterium YIM PH 21723]
MALTVEERESFLAEAHIGALAVHWRDGRAPLNVPIWYQYTPGGELWVLTGPGSHKAKAIQQAGRFSLMVQRVQPSVRYVSVEGPVTRIVPATAEQSREMAERYLPAERVEEWLEYERTELGESVAIYLRPERWLSADMGAA